MAASGFIVILQHLEIGMSPIIHDNDFAVKNSLKSELLERVHNRRELFV